MNRKSGHPILICEGKQEIEVAKKICEIFVADFNVFQLNASGNSKYSTIANKIIGYVNVMGGHCSPIIILFDREKREDTPDQIIWTLKRELEKRDLDVNEVIIGVADPYIESWILPFVDSDGNYPVDATESWDSKKCLGELEKRLLKKNIYYKKLEIGVDILCEINPQKLADVSESFKLFYEQTKNVCDW